MAREIPPEPRPDCWFYGKKYGAKHRPDNPGSDLEKAVEIIVPGATVPPSSVEERRRWLTDFYYENLGQVDPVKGLSRLPGAAVHSLYARVLRTFGIPETRIYDHERMVV